MIKSVAMENFQSHKETLIEFVSGLNVISGASDHGKSSILRALYWVIKNRPSGDSIRNWDCGKNDAVSVEIVLQNDDCEHSITKERKSNKVTYQTTQGAFLEAIGRDVPEEISNLIDISDFSIQPQHDPYFLLTTSPGNVARMLNDLVGLSVIDKSYRKLNSDISSYRDRISNLLDEQKTKTSEIEAYSSLDEMEVKLAEVEKINVQKENLTGIIRGIEALLGSIENLRSQSEKLAGIISIAKPVAHLENTIKAIRTIQTKQTELGILIENIDSSSQKLQDEREWLAIEKPFMELSETLQKITEIKEKISRVTTLVVHVEEASAFASKQKATALKLHEQLKKKLQNQKFCPFCMRQLDDATIERMAK